MALNFYPGRLLLAVATMFVLLLNSTSAFAQSQLSLAIGGSADDQGRALVQTSDGGYVIAGVTEAGAGGTDAYFTKINNMGVMQWTRYVGGSADDHVYSLIKTLDGGFAGVGTTKSFANNGDIYVVKLSSVGVVEWTRAVGTTAGSETGVQIIQIADSSYVIGGNTDNDMYIAKLTPAGALAWDKKVGQLASITDVASSITEAHGGGYVICGHTFINTGNLSTSSTDFYAVKVDASGNFVWSTVVRDPFSGIYGYDYAKSIIKTSDGGYAITGEFAMKNSGGGFNWKYGLVKLDGSGNITFTRAFGSATNDNNAKQIIEAWDRGLVIIGGMSHPSLGLREQYMVAFDQNGTYQWNRTFGSTLYGDWLAIPRSYPDGNEGYSIIQTADSGYAVAGYLNDNTGGGGDQEIHFVKFDRNIDNCNTTAIIGDPINVGGTKFSVGSAAAANGTSRTVADNNSAASWLVIDFCNPALVVNVAPTPAKCAGQCNGSAVASGRNGTAPYTFAWNTIPPQSGDTAKNLCAGSYVVTITDANMDTATANVTISEPAVLNATAVAAAASCGSNTGQVTATATGGTTNYTYTWNTNPVQNTKTATGLSSGAYIVTVTDAQQCTATATATISTGTPPTVTISTTPAICGSNNGTATANPVGGTGTYTYSWNSNPVQTTQQAINLAANSYTVTVTDSLGCTATATATVTSGGGSLVASVSINASPLAACAGTMVNFTAVPTNGGSTPAYQWQVNGVNVGTDTSIYASSSLPNNAQVTCIMTSSANCVTGSPDTSDAVTITIYPAVTAGTLTAVPDSICTGTSAALQITGNTAPVQWQSSLTAGSFTNISGATSTSYTASPSQSTYYRAYATNGNCADTSTAFLLTVLPLPAPLTVTAADSIFCASDSVQVCAANSFAAYQWNNGATTACTYAKVAGGYWATVTDANGCSAISSRKNMRVYPVSSVSIVVQGDTFYSYGAVSYQWYRDGQVINGATASTYIATSPGKYSVQVTDSNNCKATSSEFNYTSIGQLEMEQSFELFPNPASNTIYLQYTGEKGSLFDLIIYNVLGEIVASSKIAFVQGSTIPVDVSLFAKGMYFVQLRAGESAVSRKLILK